MSAATVPEHASVTPPPATSEKKERVRRVRKQDDRKPNSEHEGEWDRVDGVIRRSGKGIYEELGNRYEGNWKDDKMQGTGTFTYATGASYEGDWVDNRYEGKGLYRFPDGSSYEGEFHDNRMHGQGVFTDKNGVKFRGQF